MRIIVIALLFCLMRLTVNAQETEIFFSTQSGSPFSNNSLSTTDHLFWNYSFGVERYMANKLSFAVSYRKMFDLLGDESSTGYGNFNNGWSYEYTENITSSAIDIESKYFFEAPDEGWYLSSGLSYQHITNDITVKSVYNNSGSPDPAPLDEGVYKDDGVTIFPLSLKCGHRNSSDTFVFDYFFGMSYNMGAGNAVHKYETYFDYDQLKRISFHFGLKVCIKI